MKHRSAFTKVELIFIIIIIGIVSVTAYSRLSATREDARLSVIAHNTMVGAFEIASYAVAKGKTEPTLSTMSNAITILLNEGYATENNNSSVTIGAGSVSDCMNLRIENRGSNTEMIVLQNTGSGGACERLQNLIDASRFPIPLHGRLIRY